MNGRKTLSAATLAAVLGIGLAAALPASAQEGQGMMGGGMMGGGMMGGGMMGDGPGAGPMLDFEALDADKDGKVTKAEVDAARKAAVATTDANNDGKLSADEIAAREIARMTDRANDRAARMIVELDVDGDGLLSVSELIERPMAGRMFDRLDTDGDDAISQAELDAMRERMAERMQEGRGHRRGGGGHGGWFGQDDN